VIGEREARPPLLESYRKALELALEVARVPMVFPQPDAPEWYRGRHNGFEAYTAWAANLAQDSNYPENDDERLVKISTSMTTRWEMWPKHAGTRTSF
jgi:hypothetical protein